MAQPLLSNDRVTYQYVVDGLTHVQRVYCNRAADVGAVKKILCRDGVTTLDWDVAAQGGWSDMSNVLPTSVLGPTMTLETLVGIVWQPVAIATGTGVGQATGLKPASQLTVVIRDTAFKFMRYVIMEHSGGYIGHSNTGYGLNTLTDLLMDGITGDDADPAGLYQWMKSRGNRYILGTGAIAGATFDLNDKIKRTRHLE